MPPSTLEQFIRFGTDAAGIERILRMAQAVLAVVISQPVLTHGLGMLVALGNRHVWEEPRVFDAGALSGLSGQLATSRRFFRMFRFLECFRAANSLYASLYSHLSPAPPVAVAASSPVDPDPDPDPDPSQEGDCDLPSPAAAAAQPASVAAGPSPQQQQQHPPPAAEAWLDIFARTFNGMYLLLEALDLADALGLPLWGPAWSAALHVEGQRFWLFALACGAAGGVVRTVRLFTCAPPLPPVVGSDTGYGAGEDGKGGKDGKDMGGGGAMAEWERERERLRRVMWPRREQRRIWRSNVRSKWRGLVRRCVADFLDMAGPGSVVGWVKVDPGTVGAVQVVTTYLTGMEVWERCGRDLAKI